MAATADPPSSLLPESAQLALSDIPLSSEPALASSSALAARAGDPAARGAGNERRPNQVQLNVFNDAIPRVVDETAEILRAEFLDFLGSYPPTDNVDKIYVSQVKALPVHETTTVYVDFDHLVEHKPQLAQAVSAQYYRFEPYLKKAVQELVKAHEPEYCQLGRAGYREFALAFYNLPAVIKLRQVRTEYIGKLVTVSGCVTRTSEVRPELTFGAFTCSLCSTLVRDVEQQFKYTEPTICPKQTCMNKTLWQLQTSKSRFVDWQKVRIQENSDEIPSGAMPRSMDVILRGEIVERAKAGDKVLITGTPIVVPDVRQLFGSQAEGFRTYDQQRSKEGFSVDGVTGLKALGVRDLTYKLSFMGSFVQSTADRGRVRPDGSTGDDAAAADQAAAYMMDDESDADARGRLERQFTDEEREQLRAMRDDRLLYHKLVNSIAPHIFGHEDIKKGVLLQLLGGVHKVTAEGIHLRGDINVCIVGDPSCAKSQFLKYVSNLMPRAVYTSGKASSAAGLTASVIKDEETGEFTIEAGALMLADNGICCIDEFDKMDVTDQVAIHEAMEQQTISIAKAGIQATLNARTSILAAANPINGRYDKKLTLKRNINMSSPIMSRFDLFFVIVDEINTPTDYNIARHIVNFHRASTQDDEEKENNPIISQNLPADYYTREQLLHYLRYARSIKPRITPGAKALMVRQYREMRQCDVSGMSKGAYRITVRQLESMVRLSEGLAKLHCEEEITVKHVKEACSLLRTSIVTVDHDSVEFDDDEGAAADAAPRAAGQISETQDEEMNVDESQTAAPKKQKFLLPFDQYQKIANSVILKLHQDYEAGGDGMRVSQLVDWYLEKQEEHMESEEDFEREKKTIRGVVKKLLGKDGVLIKLHVTDELQADPPADGEDGAAPDGENTAMTAETERDEADPILMLHPNYYIDDVE